MQDTSKRFVFKGGRIIEAMRAAGLPVPDNCHSIDIRIDYNSVAVAIMEYYLTADDLKKFGAALMALGETGEENGQT